MPTPTTTPVTAVERLRQMTADVRAKNDAWIAALKAADWTTADRLHVEYTDAAIGLFYQVEGMLAHGFLADAGDDT